MKTTSPNRLIIITALVSGLVFSSLLYLIHYSEGFFTLANSVHAGIIATVIFAIAFRVAIKTFILSKVKQLYKSIPALTKAPSETSEVVDMNEDVIERVSSEMERWAIKQRREMVKLQKTADFRREFVGNLAHELKTPIFNIQGYILTLLEGALEDPAINRKFLLRAGKSVDRMIQLISELDNISKLETGEVELNLKRFDILNLVQECLEIQEISAKEKEIQLEIITSSYTPTFVKADPAKISQVLTNLVSNSIHYGKNGGKTTVSFHDLQDKIMVEISDNGIGISEEDLPRIFERFYRVDKSRNRHTGGSGLGLAISKHILEVHGEGIHVRSKKDAGTTFYFTLPKTK